MDSVYRNYVELRDAKGVKDADVSKATGIHPSTFSDWKKGKSRPKHDKLIKLAKYFSVPLDFFNEESESDYLFYPNELTEAPLLVEQVKKNNARVREDILLREYLEDVPMRRLILYAGSNLPLEDRDKYVDALIQTINTLNSFRK